MFDFLPLETAEREWEKYSTRKEAFLKDLIVSFIIVNQSELGFSRVFRIESNVPDWRQLTNDQMLVVTHLVRSRAPNV